MGLTDQNRFIGACAIVPDNRNNDVSRGTSRVITAAHKLNSLKGSESLKVRIIEYDASGFNQNTENSRHEEFLVRRFIKHPDFDPKRLSDDIAVLILDRPINLLRNKGVNAACYPHVIICSITALIMALEFDAGSLVMAKTKKKEIFHLSNVKLMSPFFLTEMNVITD